MMKKNVLLSISSTQQFEDCEPEHIDLVTEAVLYERNGKYYITYEESELTGLAGTRTMVKLDGASVSIVRTGTYPSELLFAEGQRHVGLYQTEGGLYFLYVAGGEASPYPNEDILRLAKTKVKEWTDKH